MSADGLKAEEGLDAPPCHGEDNPVGFDGHGNALIFTEEAADGLIPLIEKARKSGKIEDWHAVGVPLRIHKNPPPVGSRRRVREPSLAAGRGITAKPQRQKGGRPDGR